MIPVRLQLHNFLSFREPAPLDFTSFNLAVLSGNNGVGKSSILEAITWAIWGQTRANSDDDIILQGTNSCWVELIFEHEGSLYRILRKRDKKTKAGQSLLEFQVSKIKSQNLMGEQLWESIAEGTLKTTQEKIIKILKIPYDIFINSSYLRQGRADEFTIKTPSERKEILSQVLDLNYYEDLAIKAREKTRAIIEKNKLIDFQIDDLQIQTAQKNDLKNNYLKAQGEYKIIKIKYEAIKEKLIKLETQKKEYELLSQRRQILLEHFEDVRENITNLKIEIEDLSKQKKILTQKLSDKNTINKLFEKLIGLEKQESLENEKFKKHSQFIQELKIIEHVKNDLSSNINRIQKISKCPMCLRIMAAQEAKKIIEHLNRDFKKTYFSKYQKLKMQVEKLGYDLNNHTQISQEISQLEYIKNDKQSLDAAQINLQNLNANILKTNLNLEKLEQNAQKIISEGKALKQKMIHLEQSDQEWQEKKLLENNLSENIFALHTQLGSLDQEIKRINNQEQEIKRLQKQKLDFQKQIQDYEDLSLAFGKKGIQAMIIEQSLSTIEENANLLLRKITTNRMTLKFITQKEKKSAKSEDDIIETLDIMIADELGNRNYEMYSGGEAFRINFAIRVALSKLLASRAGTHLKFLAIDEGFGMLDSPGRDDLVAAINSISPDFEKILVITHLQELKDLFPTKIEITKDDTGSHLEVINT